MTQRTTNTPYEAALYRWLKAIVGDVDVVFAPRSAGRKKAPTYVLVQAVRRQRLGQAVRAVTTTAHEGGDGAVVGGLAHTYRVRADLNLYGPGWEALSSAIEDARERPMSLPAEARLKIETLGDWQDLSALEGPGWRERHRAELSFIWVRTSTYAARPVTDVTPTPQMLS